MTAEEFDDLTCPDCRGIATATEGMGNWRFVCRPCGRRWGHPQIISAEKASGLLHDAKQLLVNLAAGPLRMESP